MHIIYHPNILNSKSNTTLLSFRRRCPQETEHVWILYTGLYWAVFKSLKMKKRFGVFEIFHYACTLEHLVWKVLMQNSVAAHLVSL